ncbi:MAG: hypothetical protein MUF35_03005 [Candidatus Nanopelagicales bacterium]|nr:hypothetical protein [Candidatus Nanopelagicales bacterium]
MATYVKMAERKALARQAARALLAEGLPFQDLTLKQVAAQLGWPIGTLHRAYSVTAVLLNDLLLEFEDATCHAVYLVGSGGLEVELTEQAVRMRRWMDDPANVQLLRYQMTLGCRSEEPVELPLRHFRDPSWEFHRDLLVRISVAADEEYADVNALASLVTAIRDGLMYQYFSYGDADRWLADMRRAIPLLVQAAEPRRVTRRTSLADQRLTADQVPTRRREAMAAARR